MYHVLFNILFFFSVRLRLDSLAVVGSNIQLVCSMSVFGKVTFKWKFNGAVLKKSERIKISSLWRKSFLSLRKAQITDTGLYTCLAR